MGEIMKNITHLVVTVLLLGLVVIPVQAAQAQTEVACESDVIVQADDWLSKIAEKFYGDPLAFPAIADVTNTKAASDDSYATIADVNVIEPGWKLCIPSGADAQAMLGTTTPAPSVAPGSASYPEVLKFGAILNLSGPTAAQGEQFRRGLELAIELWNTEHGGIDGIPIEGIFEDHQAKPAEAVTAARKLIDVDGVTVLANVYSSPVLAVVPIADEAQVLQVSAGANSPRLVGASDYFLSNIANAGFEVEVGLAYAQKALAAKRLALVYRNDDFGNGARELLVPAWESAGGEVVIAEGHEPDQTEFATLAAKVAAASPEVLYIASSAANQGLLVKQLRESGVTIPIISYQGLEVPELFAVAGEAAKDAYWTSSATAEDQTRFNEYAEKFRAKYGEDPMIFSNTHFDLATSVFEAATQVKQNGLELSGANIRDEMLKIGTFDGVLGSVTYRADGTSVRALDLKTAEGGQPVVFMTARQMQEQGIYDFGQK
jgi:ABC-type branched-subunit amino acid transport system substrate-binding protein